MVMCCTTQPRHRWWESDQHEHDDYYAHWTVRLPQGAGMDGLEVISLGKKAGWGPL